jgi:hypothetical protein
MLYNKYLTQLSKTAINRSPDTGAQGSYCASQRQKREVQFNRYVFITARTHNTQAGTNIYATLIILWILL